MNFLGRNERASDETRDVSAGYSRPDTKINTVKKSRHRRRGHRANALQLLVYHTFSHRRKHANETETSNDSTFNRSRVNWLIIVIDAIGLVEHLVFQTTHPTDSIPYEHTQAPSSNSLVLKVNDATAYTLYFLLGLFYVFLNTYEQLSVGIRGSTFNRMPDRIGKMTLVSLPIAAEQR